MSALKQAQRTRKSRAVERVELALSNKVSQVLAMSDKDVVLSDIARELVQELREEDPDALLAYFETHAAAIFREQLQMRLMISRKDEMRKGVFDKTKLDIDPFKQRFAVEGHVWRPLGEMTRPDWRFLVEDRGKRIQASLFDITLAKKIIDRLPDDTTLTRDAIPPKTLLSYLTSAEREAEKLVDNLSK